MSSEKPDKFCSECGTELKEFEKESKNHILEPGMCTGCSLNKHREKILNKK